MARKDRHTAHDTDGANENVGNADDVTHGAPEASAPEGSGAQVDSATGEVTGEGYEQEAAPTMDVVHMPKKIVAKDIVGRAALKMKKTWKPELDKDNKQATDKDGAPLGVWELEAPKQLYVVFGTASGTRSGQSNYGDWTAFVGTFEAQRFSDGARFASNELILQEPANSLLITQLGAIKKRDPAGSVGFSFEIGVRTSQRWADTNEGNSYEYTVKSIFNTAKHDPLAHMRQALLPHLPKKAAPALEGPTGQSET